MAALIAELDALRAPMRVRHCAQCRDAVPTVALPDIQQGSGVDPQENA